MLVSTVAIVYDIYTKHHLRRRILIVRVEKKCFCKLSAVQAG